jgi:hypothetical protein
MRVIFSIFWLDLSHQRRDHSNDEKNNTDQSLLPVSEDMYGSVNGEGVHSKYERLTDPLITVYRRERCGCPTTRLLVLYIAVKSAVYVIQLY